MKVNIIAVADELAQPDDSISIDIDQIVVIERRLNLRCVQR
jgi:hypothetical protein